MDLFRVAFTYQENDGRGVGRGVIRQAFDPVFVDTATLGDRVNIVGQRQGHHVGFNTVDDGGRLLARTTVRLANHDIVAGFLLPVCRKRFVVLFIQFTRRVV